MSSKNFDWDKIMKDARLSDQKEYEKIKASNSPTQSAAQAYVNKSSSSNEKSFDEKISDLKKENRQNRRNMFLAAVAQASNNQQDQAVTDNFTSAINKYKEGKNDINVLKNSKWQESQNYNNEVMKNPDVEQLVKTAYEAKLSRDNNEKLSSEYSGTLAAFTDVGKAAMSGYSESQKTLEDAVNKLNKMGYDADSLIDTYSRQINKQDNEKLVQETEQLSNEHPFIANAAYVGANAFQVTALKETIETGLDNLINHKYAPIDTNSPAFAATNFRDTVSNTTAQNITNKIVEDTDSEKLATAGRFLYQTGLSMADFVSVAWMPQPMSLAIMGTSAAASSAKEATDRGLSAENAMATAIAAGLTEIMCEKFSIENFKALQATGNRGIKNFLTDTLKQSFTEGSEEVATDIINAMTDQFINGDMSALEQDYKNYIAQGMSEEEARRQVVTQFAKQVGESFMGGALSGGVMGAGASVVGNMAQSSRYRSAGNDIKSTGSAQELIDSGLQSNANTKSYKIAEQLQSKLDRDMYNNQTEEADYSNLSSKKLGQLQAVNDSQIVKENLINAVAGENNQEALIKAITNFTEGKGVSRADYRTIKGSEKLISAINSQYGTDFKSNNLSRIELSKLSGAVSMNPVSVAKIGEDTEQQEIKPLRQGFNIQASDASGNNVVVNNISTNDGEMTILTNDGSRLNAKDVRFADSDYNDAFRLASDYPTEAAKSFISGFEQAENTDIIDYATGFKEIYQNTLTSKAVTNDEGSVTDAIELGSRYNLTPQQSFLAYSAAVNTEIGYKSKKSSLSIKQQYDNAINSNATGLTLLGTPKTSMQKAEVELLKGFAEDKGLSVIVVDSVKSVLGEDSNAATVNGKIVIGLDSDNGMLLPYAGHELFHLLKNNNGSKNMAKELQSFIIDTLKSDAGYDYDTRFNELQESYNFKGTEAEITEQINEEIAGNACFTVLSQEENFTRLVKQNKSLAQRVKDFFADFVKKIRDRLVKLSKINPEYRALENNLKAQQKILDMFEKCLDSVQKYNINYDTKKYSLKNTIKMTWNEQINQYFSKNPAIKHSDTLFLFYSSEINDLDKVENKPIGVPISVISKAINQKNKDHNVDKNTLIMLDKKLKNNIAVIDNPDRNSIVFISNDNGKYLVTSVLKNQTFDGDEVHKVTSIHNRDNILPLLEKLPDNATVIVNKKSELKTTSGTLIQSQRLNAKFKFTNNIIGERLENVNKFSLKEPVEQKKDLVAVHNLSEEKMLKSLSLGGLPMPSIAIAKAKYGHTEFGKISLIFPASTIDPERKSNQVYSGDAYTPTYPQIEYKLSSKADELYDRALNLKGAALYKSVRYDPDNVLDRIQRIGKDEFLKKEIVDYGLKQLYLYETTGETVPLQYKTNRSELDSETISKYDYIAEHMMEEILNEEGLKGREWNAKYYEKFKETINSYYKSLMPSLTEEELENIFNNEFPIRPKVLNTVSAVKRYIRYGAVTEETVSDETATMEQIDKLVDKADYEKWFNNLYDGIIEKEGIRNNVDIYTNSGNRRSFEALHYEHNLENVIRAMKEQGKHGIGAFGKNIFGASKVNYNSISDIKDNSDKLINGSDAEAKALYEELRSDLSHRFYELASALPIHKGEFLATDSACEVLTEAVLKFKTKTGMDNYIKDELKGWANYSPSIIDDLIQIVDDIRSLPAAYFEAKPQRAVNFNEIYTAVIPDNSSDELIDRLDDNGIRYIKYEAGNDQNRVDIINSLDDVKFSRREQKDYDTLLKENAQLQQANEILKEELQLTKGHKLNQSSIKSVVNKLVDEHGAYHINKEELEDRLTGLYSYIANAGVNIDDSYVWTVANDIGRTIADGSSVKDTTFYNQYKDLKKRLRETAITVPPEVRKYVSAYANINKIKVRNQGDISLDSFYTELTHDYPEFFDPEIMTEEDELARIIEVYESIVPIYTDRLSQTEYSLDEYSSIVAAEIFEKYFDVKEVQTFADKKQKEIEQLKLHYNNTISDMREGYQKRYEQREKELKEKLKETRKEGNERLIRQQAHFTEMSLNAFRRKRRTLIKNKIANVKKDLTRRLLNPTETAYVPRSLVQSIADVCDIINETEIKDQNGFDRSQSIISALQNLHYNYEALKNEEDVDYASEYEQEMGTKIAILKDTLEKITNANGGNAFQISQLDADYLNDIYHILRDIKNALVDATYQIGLEEKITNHERGIKLINEINATKGQKSTKVGRYELETLNPIRAVRKMTEYNEDAELFKMVNEINLGQRKADKFISDATKPFEMLRSNLKEFKRFSENLIETDIVDEKGNNVELTENEIVQLIMTMKRKQGKVHLMEGGFNLPDRKLMSKGNYKEALSKGIVVERVNPYVVNKMYSNLSDYAKTWISASEYLFNTQGKDAINEVSMLLKHRKIASAENYIPLNVDTDFTNTEISALKFDNTIEGMGSLKSVAPKAKQPLVIAGLNTVVERHIKDVSKYYGLAIPIRNINKVITTQTSAYYDSQMKKSSVKTAIRDKWGDAGLKLIENLITDVQTTRKSNSSTIPDEVFSKIQSGFVQATLAGNISVTIKQAASYPTALANVSGKSLAAGLPVFSYSTSKFENLCNEIDEHTGIHFKRRIGMSVPEIGELKKNNSLLNKFQTATTNQKVNNKINIFNPMKWIQSMDVRTTAALWVAAKEEVKLLYPNIKVNSEDYWDKVTELYEETIENTQPNYDVLHRPELQKTTNQLTRAVIMFKTQPLQNTGILYDSAFELKQMNREYKNNGSAENEIKLKKAKKKFKKAVVSQFSAALTFSAMSLLASAIKHTMYGYRDEDDDVTLSSVLKGVMDNMFNLMSTLLLPLGGGEIYEAVTSIGSKNSNDFISVPVVSTINDLWESISRTVETANGVISDEKTTVDLLKSIENLSYSVATVLGIPAKNLINYGKGIIANVKDIANGEFGKFESGVDRTNSQKVSLYGKYYLKNDEVKSSEIVREMIADKVSQGKTEEEARASVRDSFASYYKPLYQEAVKKGDTKAKNDIISILTTTGVFTYKTKGRTLSVVLREWEEEAKKEE